MITLRKNIAAMDRYVPGFQPEETGWIKLNTNENPYPPSPKVVEAIQAELVNGGENLRKYPDAGSKEARRVAAELYGVDPSWVIMANGSDELLNNLIRAFADAGDEVGFVHPSYSYYSTLAHIQGAKVVTFGLTADTKIADFPDSYRGKVFFLTSPNAPLGLGFDNTYISELADRCRGVLVVDEAYVDFTNTSAMELVKKHENIVVTRTFSKSYSLAGMRLGLAVARPEVIAALDKIRDHYHLDRLALVAAAAALKDQPYLRSTVAKICATRDWFSAELRQRGYHVHPSQTNYIFAEAPDGDGKRIYDTLFAHKILVRYFSDPLLASGTRISMGTREEMEKTLAVLSELD
ncbi:histidinol phosphate aminotransferase apoenzyme [Desulfuromusa kysingii]|uniref:Histidinol-phosphate aminotransferase n=1 Tax=Desulfuromusa kysingii TaxID=37625 RepID=A0A1H3VGA0_9BACT|nr:histidinol-phosphate transaminase [Desulfuromusa kysingii]SDZ73691.1 histidinol phosphate aminotransferase apoenzyme [Desulfuromusa kysingii]